MQRWCIVNESTGGKVDILTSDAFSSHGSRPDLILLNEVSHVQWETIALTILDNFSKMPDAFALLCHECGHAWQLGVALARVVSVRSTLALHQGDNDPAWQTAADIAEAERRDPRPGFADCTKASGFPLLGTYFCLNKLRRPSSGTRHCGNGELPSGIRLGRWAWISALLGTTVPWL